MLSQIDPNWLFVTNACLVALFGIMYGKKTAEHADRKLLKDLVDSLQAQKPGQITAINRNGYRKENTDMLITAFIQGAEWVYSKHDVVMSQNDELEAQITAIQQHEQGALGIEDNHDRP